MDARLLSLPLIVILMGIGALSMMIPAAHAAVLHDWHVARVFLYSSSVFLVLTGFIGLATSPYRPSHLTRSRLIALVLAYSAIPLMLAVPLHEALPDTTYLRAYFEMVSSLTTTGATVYDDPSRLAPSLHLWRALVGWMGGFFIWLAAVAMFQPMNLGGFEVLSGVGIGDGGKQVRQITEVADPAQRMARFSVTLFPVYAGLTLVLWLGLMMAGETSLVAFCHAMSTLASSGISPVGGLENAGSGRGGEMIVFVFLAFALSRKTFDGSVRVGRLTELYRDPEVRMGLALIVIVPGLLFLRHWFGAFEVDALENFSAGVASLWGGVFTVASFLTTTGFVSADWIGARDWSGLPTPGLILMGLALIGGGVATTAGGVKLLRVYALYMQGKRELEKLVEPNSVAGAGAIARQMRRQGAYIAWLFFMLFAVSIAVVMLALSLDGLSLNDTIVFAIAALSTTGPVAAVAGELPLSYADLSDSVRMILAAAMIVGRIETLAIVALLNPDLWRR